MPSHHELAAGADPRRWRALSVLATVQFILVLDLTVVNVALRHIKQDLHFSASALPWVVNGYTLMAAAVLVAVLMQSVVGRRRVQAPAPAAGSASAAPVGGITQVTSPPPQGRHDGSAT
jgi:MFS family permease